MYKLLFICLFPLAFIACSDNKKQDIKEDVSTAQTTQTIADSPKSTSVPEIAEEVKPEEQMQVETQVDTTPDAHVLYGKCAACHGKDGKSVAPGSVGNVLIASMNKAQVIESLKGFRARTLSRGGNSVIMYMQTKNLSDADIEALATYIDSF